MADIFYLKRSFLFHLLFIVICVGASSISSLFRKKVEVTPAVRVDIVAMPDLTLRQLKELQFDNWEETFEKNSEPIPKEKSFDSLLRNISRKKVNTKSPVKKRGKKTSLEKLLLKGNLLSKGQLATGDTRGQESDELSLYAGRLPVKIRPYWKLPRHLLDRGLKCRIRVFIDPRGRLIRAQIIEESSDKDFDTRALNAIRQASPFVAPSKKIRYNVGRGDIILGFPL